MFASSLPAGVNAPGFGSDVIADALRALDIPYIALTPGASYRGLHDSIVNFLGNETPQMLLCLHEESAVAIAHGYAKVTGKPMAAAVHANIGLTPEAQEAGASAASSLTTLSVIYNGQLNAGIGKLGMDAQALEKLNVLIFSWPSLGAFMPAGIRLRLIGDSNDYVGKGLSGGTIVVRPDERSGYKAEENIIAGNVIGYGATSGTIHLRGIVGERFLVRNSGVTAVVEGVGDHALEYMTGGTAVILGRTGRNLGAGMSGGVAYIYKLRADRVNHEALATGELHLGELDERDAAKLKQLLEQHLTETGSTVAERILANWQAELGHFTRVMPRDFANVMEIRERAIGAGNDPDSPEVWSQILEVTNG